MRILGAGGKISLGVSYWSGTHCRPVFYSFGDQLYFEGLDLETYKRRSFFLVDHFCCCIVTLNHYILLIIYLHNSSLKVFVLHLAIVKASIISSIRTYDIALKPKMFIQAQILL